MPFVPHTEEEVKRMLSVIGADSIEDLFDEIPKDLISDDATFESIPSGMSEMEITSLMQQRASKDDNALCFIGAGAYDHHIPAAVWQLTTRGEYYSAYTPYQAEASQGTLQLLYEYQSMMTELMAMDVSNASLYDGASALAEAILMAVRGNRKSKSKRVLVPRNLHPDYRRTVEAIVSNQDIELVEIPYDPQGGHTNPDTLADYAGQDFVALVIAQPNFFGVLEEVDALTDWAHANNMLAIGVVNPLAMSVLEPPGRWGESGVDICCGEGQPLGAPLASGGPYFGFMCTTDKLVRQMPGRIIGKTVDLDGNPGYTLTLQAREQHIRRSKATSNICTNQGLLVTAATIYMSLLGAEGLARTASASYQNTHELVNRLVSDESATPIFNRPYFHECALCLPIVVSDALRTLAGHNILGGYDLSNDYPELGESLLVCATEKRTKEDIEQYASKLARVIGTHTKAPCPVTPKFNV